MKDAIYLGNDAKWSKPFILSCLYFDYHESLGWGIFTSEFIKKSTMIEVAPVILLGEKKLDDSLICNYMLEWDGDIAIPFGWTMHYNHSDNNSCSFAKNVSDQLLGIISVRDINPNEQVTVSYGDNWFKTRKIEKINI